MLLTVYGLDELAAGVEHVTCLWLLHGRGDTQDSMAFVAGALLNSLPAQATGSTKGVIAVTFDQRNHGSRLVDPKANVSWKQGNPTHGIDMFNIFSGTAMDVSTLIDHLPSYLPLQYKSYEHVCLGVSLGGHATWQVLLAEPRVRAGVVVIGCPDYTALMTDRAVRSQLASTLESKGTRFAGSEDFPPALLKVIAEKDPAGLLLGDGLSREEQKKLLNERLGGKKILSLSGGKDKLVPYKQGERALGWLKEQSGLEVKDVVDDGAGHELSAHMREVAEKWFAEVVRAGETGGVKSKI